MAYKFNVETTTQSCIEWIQHWFDQNGKDCKAIIGISGGKDSSVAAALCVKALGADRVVGVLMPDGLQADIGYSFTLCKELGIQFIKCNIESMVHETLESIKAGMFNRVGNVVKPFKISDQTKINLPPRLRMAMLYAISQSMHGRVCNTCNLSEDAIGYSTRWGDNVGDFAPLQELTSDEVIAIGEYLGLSQKLTRKPPSDGLCGKTDEENFGFTYAELNAYIRTGECENPEVKQKIQELHDKNSFKRFYLPHFSPSYCCLFDDEEDEMMGWLNSF